MSDLTEFLLARIAEDEAVAEGAALDVGWDGFGESRIRSGQRWVARYHEVCRPRPLPDEAPAEAFKRMTIADCGALGLGPARHIARHDPARVLAECEAKRRIVAGLRESERLYDELCDEDSDQRWEYLFRSEALTFAAKSLALPYADHPDFRGEWRA
ncbi:MAG: DUF6221 family protein [Propionibacterium sp.]|nr:DUF6221 family protein [Propionibacterium sp.]